MEAGVKVASIMEMEIQVMYVRKSKRSGVYLLTIERKGLGLFFRNGKRGNVIK